MKSAVSFALIGAICSSPALAGEGAARTTQVPRSNLLMPHHFDLAEQPASADRVPAGVLETIEVPRNLDLREFAVDPPAASIPISNSGLELAVGAMGAKYKDAPRLAHIAIGMDF